MAVSQLKSDLQESRARLFDAIRGLSEEQFRFVPPEAGAGTAGRWSIATHLAHLLRIERLYASRARLALDDDGAPVASSDAANDGDPGLAQKLAVPQMIHGLLNVRRDLDAVLDAGGDGSLERGVTHERAGRVTIAELAAKVAAHEAEHTADIVRLVRQVPASGRVTIPLTRRS